MSQQPTKSDIRRELIERRRGLLEEERALKNMLIFERAHKHPAFQLAQHVHVYRSLPDEVETWPIIEYAWGIGKQVWVPVVSSDGSLQHVLITRDTQWKHGRFGIEEPVDREVVRASVDFSVRDVVIVPLVAFDQSCHRLGYGKGMYDRFLAKAQAYSIGVAFEIQRVRAVPVSQTDVQLDAVATEERWYRLEGSVRT